VESVGVRELRKNVAAVLRRAATGERIVVTVDGVPAAQLGPIEPTTSPTLEDLVASGLVQPPQRPGVAPAEPAPIDVAVDIRIDDVLAELRGRG
jgi:prevent-host-death family protein